MTPEFREFPSDGPLFEGAVRVHAAAFSLPPYDPAQLRDIGVMLRVNHAEKPGIARMVAVIGGETVAMGYGYHVPEEDWWGERVRANLSAGAAREWLGDAFSVVELAVEPRCQRQGIGGRLLARLLADRAERTAVLSTRTESEAHRLYRRHGFETLAEMRFDGAGPLFLVMGRRL